jgi:CYTH domain-containing protein
MIRAERGFERAIEGHFPRQPVRNSYVHIRGDGAELVLVNASARGEAEEERTQVPRSHAEALLDVCAGAVVYERSRLPIADGQDATIDRTLRPQPIDIIVVSFHSLAEAEAFAPPAWFGPEVGDDFAPRAIALDGVAPVATVQPTNAALDALLDLAEAGLLRRLTRDDARAGTASSEPQMEREEAAPRPVPRPASAAPPREEAVAAAEPVRSEGQRAEGEPAISSLRSIFSAQRPVLPPRERQRIPGE